MRETSGWCLAPDVGIVAADSVTAIEASVNIQDDLAMSSGCVMGSSPLSCMFDFPVYQGLIFQPKTKPIPKQQSATTAGF